MTNGSNSETYGGLSRLSMVVGMSALDEIDFDLKISQLLLFSWALGKQQTILASTAFQHYPCGSSFVHHRRGLTNVNI